MSVDLSRGFHGISSLATTFVAQRANDVVEDVLNLDGGSVDTVKEMTNLRINEHHRNTLPTLSHRYS